MLQGRKKKLKKLSKIDMSSWQWECHEVFLASASEMCLPWVHRSPCQDVGQVLCSCQRISQLMQRSSSFGVHQIQQIKVWACHVVTEAFDDHGTPPLQTSANNLLDAHQLHNQNVIHLWCRVWEKITQTAGNQTESDQPNTSKWSNEEDAHDFQYISGRLWVQTPVRSSHISVTSPDLLVAGIRFQEILLFVLPRRPATLGWISTDHSMRRGIFLVEVVVLQPHVHWSLSIPCIPSSKRSH